MLWTAAMPLAALVVAFAAPSLAGPSVEVRSDAAAAVVAEPGGVSLATPDTGIRIAPEGVAVETMGPSVRIGPDGLRIAVPPRGEGAARSALGLVVVDPEDAAPFEVDGAATRRGKRTEGASRTFRVHNEGGARSAPLRVSVQNQSPGATNGFSLAANACAGRALPPDGSCEFVVTPHAERDGWFPGWLHVAAEGDAVVVPLSAVAEGFDP